MESEIKATTSSTTVSTQAAPKTTQSSRKRSSDQGKMSYSPEMPALTRSSGLTTTVTATTRTETTPSIQQSHYLSGDQGAIAGPGMGSGFVSHSTDTSQIPTYYDETLKLKVTGDESAEYWTIVEPDYFADLEGASSTPVVTSRVYKPSYQVSSDRSDTQSINVSDSDRVIDITLSDSEGEDTARTAPTSQYIHAPSKLRIVTGTAKETVVESGSGEQGATSKGLSTKKQRQMHRQRKFTCEECDREFTRETYFSVHMFRAHSKKIYVCKNCKKSFAKKNRLRDHEKIHTGEQLPRVLCEYCGKYFVAAHYLTLHQSSRCSALKTTQQDAVALRTKTPQSQGDTPEVISGGEGATCRAPDPQLIPAQSEMPTAISTGAAGEQSSEGQRLCCEYCGMCFGTDVMFIKHLEDSHPLQVKAVLSHKCRLCSEIFSTRELIEEHIFCVHKKYPVTCQYCEKGFHHQKDLFVHLESVHNKQRPDLTCRSCKATFSLYEDIRKHVLLCTYFGLHEKLQRTASVSSTPTHRVQKTPSKHDIPLSQRRDAAGSLIAHVTPVVVDTLGKQVVIGKGEKTAAESCPEDIKHSCKFCGRCYTRYYDLTRHVCEVQKKWYQQPPDAG